MNNREACIVLNMLSGIGYAKYKALVTEFEEPSRVFSAVKSDLTRIKGISDTIADKILNYKELVDLDNELLRAERGGVQILTLADEEYPEELRNIYDPPLCLYVRGKLPAFKRNAVAIVGSRKMSMYGERMTKAFAQDAVNQGFIVVSGLAFGVDYAAHKAVVDSDGITVAVLGGGLTQIHPREHIPLAREIIQKGGAVISEFPMDFPVSRTSFPRRNRIVSALSDAVIVIEAGLDSGALITANVALEQGKEVFAVPGNADNPQARGCHKLIRESSASLAENFSQVLEVLDGGLFHEIEFAEEPLQTFQAESCLSEDEKIIVELLQNGEKTMDDLALETNMESGKLLGTLMKLEMKFVILKNPDRSYRLR